MPLPSVRNTTYAPSSQILSADLNAIQDCIIANKHGQLELELDAEAFRGDSNALGTLNANGYVSGFAGAGTVRANIPGAVVGKRIVSVEVFYSINGTAAGLTPKLRKKIQSTGVQADVIAGALDNTGGAGVIESQVLGANHVMLTGNSYFVEVTVTNAGHQVHGAKILLDAP